MKKIQYVYESTYFNKMKGLLCVVSDVKFVKIFYRNRYNMKIYEDNYFNKMFYHRFMKIVMLTKYVITLDLIL